MPFRRVTPLLLAFGLGLPGESPAADAPVVAATRPEMKQLLEGSKQSRPRLPLPEPTAEETAAANERPGPGVFRGIVNNARMRQLYLPRELTSGGFSREPDPAMTLSPTLKTMFFWIVSRANNCYYCQGHQESKLSADGVGEAQIAALDGDWSEFGEADRAAFGLARKLTYEPHSVTDADIDRLRRLFSDVQILEIILTVAGNNAMNRWTGALAIPQEGHRVYLTPTPARFEVARSLVAPLDPDRPGMACALPARRGPLESREEVEAALDACRKRSPRLPLVDEAKARALLPADWPSGPLTDWVRLLANFPKAGKDRADLHRKAAEVGRLAPVLKAQVAWIAARNDRAWYALGHARQALLDLGMTDDAIFALDAPGDGFGAGEKAVFALARKLTVDPALITDGDIEGLRQHFSDHEVAEVVFQVTEAAFFDRLTEASGLRLEEGVGRASRGPRAGR